MHKAIERRQTDRENRQNAIERRQREDRQREDRQREDREDRQRRHAEGNIK